MKVKHYYEVIINHDINISFYTNRTYEVGDTRNGGVITSIISHEEF